jgi:ketosteroid isomerase-like protein
MYTQTDSDALDRIRSIVQEAENKGDLALMIPVLADDLTVIAPNSPVIRTKQGGINFLQSWFDAFHIQITYYPQHREIEGQLAYEWDTYEQVTINKITGEKARENGRMLWIYKKFGDEWFQHFIIWNTFP